MKEPKQTNIGGVIFTLQEAKKFKEKEFKANWEKFLTIDVDSAWVLIQRFIESNKRRK